MVYLLGHVKHKGNTALSELQNDFLLIYPIVEQGFSSQIMQEARESHNFIHVEPTNPHGFPVLSSM